MPTPAKKPAKVRGVKKPGMNPYTYVYRRGTVAGYRDEQTGDIYPTPSGGVGPKTGKPAGGYRSRAPLTPAAAKAVRKTGTKNANVGSGKILNPPNAKPRKK